ncbi:ABC transporter permease [Thermoactinomyces sp. DSM 45892]|uniref:ABC transporter permease n=1 Tax=Thermoactinomyces sp. DSM 45892 TaxID=1882753 RepID=UPI00089A6042|nr:ABC transporter permease [Thermoactinomyces sp. DSM 45892]SDY11344.1 putative ABC transport system permease protein [Thermoactinomyces sp. DSM 45892]
MTFKQFALHNVLRNLSSYLAFFMASTVSVMVFFIFSVASFHPDIYVADTSTDLADLLTIILTFQYGCSLIFILYSFGTFLHRRWREFGLLRLLGITDLQLIKLMFLENILIGFISIISGILLGLLFSKYFFFVISMIFQFPVEFHLSAFPIWFTFISFISLFMSVSILSPFFIRSKNIYFLLTKSRKQSRQSKTSLIQAVSGITIILLMYGWLVYQIQNHDKLKRVASTEWLMYSGYNFYMDIAILIVITYLLFSQISMLGMTLLKRNSRFYFYKTNLLWISSLAHQAKQNVRNLFMSTILFTVSLAFTANLFTSYLYTAEQLLKEYLVPISYLSYPEDKHLQENINYIDTYLDQNEYEYEKVQTPILALNNLRTPWEKTPIAVLSNSNFNQLARFLGRAPISLEGKDSLELIWEGWGVNTPSMFHQKEMEVGGKKLNIIGTDDTPYFKFVAQIFYVLSDELYREVKSSYPTYTLVQYQIPDWTRLGDFSKQISKRFNNASAQLMTAADNFQGELVRNKTFFFIGSFISILFFIAAISFLYFRLFANIQEEREKYRNLTNIGLKRKEIKRIITRQLSIFFFTPFIVASFHTYLILILLNKKWIELAPFDKILQVLTIFGVIQILYFIWIRSKYIRMIFRYVDLGKS